MNELVFLGIENGGTYGFPTVVCGWFMFRLEKILLKMDATINQCPLRGKK